MQWIPQLTKCCYNIYRQGIFKYKVLICKFESWFLNSARRIISLLVLILLLIGIPVLVLGVFNTFDSVSDPEISVSMLEFKDPDTSKEDVEAEVDKTYSIQGTATHDHSLTISASEFASLKSNQSIQVTSAAGGGHSHAITVTCA